MLEKLPYILFFVLLFAITALRLFFVVRAVKKNGVEALATLVVRSPHNTAKEDQEEEVPFDSEVLDYDPDFDYEFWLVS